MRSAIAFSLTFVLLAAACEQAGPMEVSPSATLAAPRFATNHNGATVSIVNDRYYSEGESFPTCDGSGAYGNINWHEVDFQVTTPDGVSRFIVHLNVVGGTAIGVVDGTVYRIQQVNSEQFYPWPPTQSTDFKKDQIRIMLISPGKGPNLFLTRIDFVWNVECRG